MRKQRLRVHCSCTGGRLASRQPLRGTTAVQLQSARLEAAVCVRVERIMYRRSSGHIAWEPHVFARRMKGSPAEEGLNAAQQAQQAVVQQEFATPPECGSA